MACLNMFNNNDQQQGLHTTTMGPRISFSNDFIDTQQQPIKPDHTYREAPVSSDFEFSVSGYNMISADELFSKGKLLPVFTKKTLRDELLLVQDHDDHISLDVSPQLSRGTARWRDRLGLKKPYQLFHRKGEKNAAEVLQSIDESESINLY